MVIFLTYFLLIFFYNLFHETNSIKLEILIIQSMYSFFYNNFLLLSIKINKDKFFNNLISVNYFNTPKFLNKNYLPKRNFKQN